MGIPANGIAALATSVIALLLRCPLYTEAEDVM